MINLCAMYKILQSHLKGRAFYFSLGRSANVGLLSENHHVNNLIASDDLLSNEGVVLLLWITSYTPSLSG